MTWGLKKDKALAMRRSGKSLNVISDHLGVPKSTLSYWCRDIVLTDKQLLLLKKRQRVGALISAEKNKQKRIFIINKLLEEGVKEIGYPNNRELLLIGASLYWAEGYKDGGFGFTNSSTKMVKVIIKWLETVCGTKKENIILRVCINHLHKNRIVDINQFWSKVTNIPLNQFTKPILIKIKNKKKYLNSDRYFGTLRIKVRRSTNLQRKIMGWIEGIAKSISVA